MTTKEELTELLERLDALKSSGKVIIVEGKKDKAALTAFGITNIEVLSKKPIYEICEGMSMRGVKEVILLTDLDKEGKKLYGKLNSELGNLGINVDSSYREFFFKETKLTQIEGLTRYIEGLRESKGIGF